LTESSVIGIDDADSLTKIPPAKANRIHRLQRLKLFVEGSWSQALQATPKSVCAHNPVNGEKLLVKRPLCETRV